MSARANEAICIGITWNRSSLRRTGLCFRLALVQEVDEPNRARKWRGKAFEGLMLVYPLVSLAY